MSANNLGTVTWEHHAEETARLRRERDDLLEAAIELLDGGSADRLRELVDRICPPTQ